MHKFNLNDRFPSLGGETVAHGRVTLPDDVPASQWSIVLAYRAQW